MRNISYSDKQTEAANLLRDTDAPQGAIDEIMNLFADAEKLSLRPVMESKDESVDAIKMKLLDEKDWRKRASLSAMLISKSLE